MFEIFVCLAAAAAVRDLSRAKSFLSNIRFLQPPEEISVEILYF